MRTQYDKKGEYETVHLLLHFFLLLTLGLFYIMNTLSSRTLQESLVNASKNQLAYAEEIIDGAISEASMYGINIPPTTMFGSIRTASWN